MADQDDGHADHRRLLGHPLEPGIELGIVDPAARARVDRRQPGGNLRLRAVRAAGTGFAMRLGERERRNGQREDAEADLKLTFQRKLSSSPPRCDAPADNAQLPHESPCGKPTLSSGERHQPICCLVRVAAVA